MISWWEVLKASKGLPVTNYYAQMWGKQLGAAGYVIADLTAPLPLTITADGTALIDYRIYGNTVDGESVGVETESGEPPGYKLPMVSRGDNYREETPIYIGDTKLTKDEYVSYSEQKVYKYNGELTLKGDETIIDYYGIFEGIQTFYIDIPNNSKIVSGLQPYLSCNYYPVTSSVRPVVDKTCRYQSPNNNDWDIGRVYFMDNDYTNLSSFKTHLSELYDAGKPLKVRYTLNNPPISIDPPVPLPALPTTKGATTFEYDGGEPAPEQIYVKYRRKD